MAHIAAAFAVAFSAITFVLAFTRPAWVRFFSVGDVFASDLRLVLASLGTALGGFVIEPFIMDLCLLVLFKVFGPHWNETFSALALLYEWRRQHDAAPASKVKWKRMQAF